MTSVLVNLVTLFLTLSIGGNEAARILAIIPIPSYSHQIPFRPLWKSLARRGHEVYLVTPDPMLDNNLKNLTQFDTKKSYEHLKSVNFLNEERSVEWLVSMRELLIGLGEPFSEYVYTHPEFRKVYAANSGQKFDVVIVETVVSASCYAFAHRFDAPLIGVQSLNPSEHIQLALGNPVLPSHPSNWQLYTDDDLNLSFWRRLYNFVRLWNHLLNDFDQAYYGVQQRLADKYLGNVPSVREMEKNMSIILVNAHPELSFVRPSGPNVITFGSLHVTDNLKPLEKELKEFLDSATNGFIYVSLGTNVKTTAFSTNLKNIFVSVLSNLPIKVVWKYQGEELKSKNIYTAPWFPQQNILGHPNIKLFVYQGGLQSTEEAVHFGVPLVGLPVLADQYMQINKLASLGACKRVKIHEIKKEVLDEAIRDVLTDKRYKENMMRISNLVKDKPMRQLDNVIWWIEYVIRHKGAPHLHSILANEPWYQRYDTDVIAFLSIALFLALLLSLYIIYKTLIFIVKCYTMMVTSKKKKLS